MKYQVDQSGKIEDTARDTVLAACNGSKYSVLVAAKDKRRLQEKFRLAGKPELFIYAVFASALYFLVSHLPNKHVVVDIEYSGKSNTIDKMVAILDGKISLSWKLIGKNSPAHDLAYRVFKGKLKVGRRLVAKEIWPRALKITGGRLKIGLSPTNRRSAPVNRRIIHKLKKKSR